MRLRLAIAVVAGLGAAIASYLTAVKLGGAPIACSTGGCDTVAHSRYASVDRIPTASFGLAAYLFVLASALVALESLVLGAAVVSLASVIVAAALVYVQAAMLHAYCQWCLASDALYVVLFVLTLARALRVSERASSAGQQGGSSPSARRAAARARGRREAPSPPSPRTD